MNISELTIRLILLFIPGFISFILVDRLTVHRQTKLHHILMYSSLLGFISYFGYFVIVKLAQALSIQLEFSFLTALTDTKVPLNFGEIISASCLAVFVGFALSFLINRQFLHRIGQILHITKVSGEIDVWSNLFNNPTTQWIVVRDLSNDIMYDGWVEAFSDSTDQQDELLLREVKVYQNSTGKEMYETPALYLSRHRGDLQIELRSV